MVSNQPDVTDLINQQMGAGINHRVPYNVFPDQQNLLKCHFMVTQGNIRAQNTAFISSEQ